MWALVNASLGITVFSLDIINYQTVLQSLLHTFVACSQFADNDLLHPAVIHTGVLAGYKIHSSFSVVQKRTHSKIQKHSILDYSQCELDDRAISKHSAIKPRSNILSFIAAIAD
jgi:hypothetical protein